MRIEQATHPAQLENEDRADRAVLEFHKSLARQYGVQLASGAIYRHVGLMLLACPRADITHVGCRFLAAAICRSLFLRLTGRRYLQ